MNSRRNDQPFRTMEIVVGLIVSFMVVFASVMGASTILGVGSIPGANAEVCVTTSGEGPNGFRKGEGQESGPAGLGESITWRADEVQICDPEPDAVTRSLAGVGLLVWIGAPLLFFAMLWRLLRRARVEGVFADRIPGGLRRLGSVLLVWAVLDFVVTGLVNGALLTRMTTDDTLVFFQADVTWLLVLLGLALLALERVMTQAVAMRHDVEATI